MSNARLFLSIASPGIARAEQQDGSWNVSSLLGEFDVRCLVSDPHHLGTFYVGTQQNGVLRSVDYGLTWFPSGLENQTVKSLGLTPAKPDLLIAGTKPPLIYASEDGGQSWRELEAFRKIPSRPFWRSPAEKPGIAYVQSVAISPTDPNLIVAGIEVGAVVLTNDGGKTWPGHRKGAVRDCHNLIFHATDPHYVYEAGGTGTGVAISKDGGETWDQPRNGLDRHYGWAVAADPADPTIWYVSVAPGPVKAHSERANADACIFRSANGGAWEKLSGGLPQPLSSMPYALTTDPASPGHLYAGMHNGEIWHTLDHGDHWNKLTVNMGRIDGGLILVT